MFLVFPIFMHVYSANTFIDCMQGIHLNSPSLEIVFVMCYKGCHRIHPLLNDLFQLLAFVIFLLKVFQEIHPSIGASCFTGISLISICHYFKIF